MLGIDPGLRLTGYACVEGDERRPRIVEAGVFRLVRGSGEAPPIVDRLDELERDLRGVIERTRPDSAAVESLFAHYKHPATAMMMAHARGVILLTLRRAGIVPIELAPRSVKLAMTGSGRAGKRQVQASVATVYGLSAPPGPADISDALAIAFAAMVRGRGAGMV